MQDTPNDDLNGPETEEQAREAEALRRLRVRQRFNTSADRLGASIEAQENQVDSEGPGPLAGKVETSEVKLLPHKELEFQEAFRAFLAEKNLRHWPKKT
jgi:hypothetical protein